MNIDTQARRGIPRKLVLDFYCIEAHPRFYYNPTPLRRLSDFKKTSENSLPSGSDYQHRSKLGWRWKLPRRAESPLATPGLNAQPFTTAAESAGCRFGYLVE